MVILHIDSGAEMRGGQWQAFYLLRGLAKAGHGVRLLAPDGSPIHAFGSEVTFPDADQAPLTGDDRTYDERADVSVADAVAWAEAIPYPVTLYLYDLGSGIRVLRNDETEHYFHCANRFASWP